MPLEKVKRRQPVTPYKFILSLSLSLSCIETDRGSQSSFSVNSSGSQFSFEQRRGNRMCRFAVRSTERPLSTRRHCLSSRPDEDKHIELTANLCYHSSFYLWLHEWIKNKRKYLRNTFERYSHFPVGKGENAGKQVSEGLIKFYLVAAQFYTVLHSFTQFYLVTQAAQREVWVSVF